MDQRRARRRGRHPRRRRAPAQHFERPAWEERYCGDQVWGGQVNVQLQAEVADMAPGRALDVGCGEGGDALRLAAQGWDVTAVNFADAALARVAEHAAQAGVADRVTTRRIGVRTFGPDGEKWDLVTAHFVHLPDGGMLDVTRRLGSAVAPGGMLFVVGHHPGDLAPGCATATGPSCTRPTNCCPRSAASGISRSASRDPHPAAPADR